MIFFFFSSRRRHTRYWRDWSSDVCSSDLNMEDVRTLKALQLDALREVANIGAGHAATALSQMGGSPIMFTVARINITPLEEVPAQLDEPEQPIAAVLMHMLGHLPGRTLLASSQPTAIRLAE